MAIPLLPLCVHPKIWKIQNIYLTRTNVLIQMSEFKDGLLKLNLKQRLKKVMLILEDVKLRLKTEKLRMMLLLDREGLRIKLLLEEDKLCLKLCK
jgi:hypothetical protein